MANPEHLAKLKKYAVNDEGIKVWNRWREENPTIRPDLSGAIFREAYLFSSDLGGAELNGTYLSGANLGSANLHRACISDANLLGADLAEANLSEVDSNRTNFGGARFSGTNLSNANLMKADLSGANFRWSNLREANLRGTNLCNATISEAFLDRTDLTGTSLGYTTFTKVDLSEVRGLETVVHLGPSSIGIDTIYLSKGKIPLVFLRGTGVPEDFIKNMKFMDFTSNEFYSPFISYSTKDQEFAERLHSDLQDKGVRCWKDDDLRGGKKVHEQIVKAIHKHDKLLLILSPASMASEWVRTEIAIARKREVEQKKEVLFPIGLCSFETIKKWEYFDSDIGKDSAREIREFHIPDFSNWKDHDSYRLAFDQLLKDLQGKPEAASA
jgi:hypothetical protein